MEVRFMDRKDLESVSEIHQAAFSRQTLSFQWLESSLNGFPRLLCFVATQNNDILGYIIWAQKSGFRTETILDLDQIAVLPEYQNQGIGKTLINDSLVLVKKQLAKQSSTLKHITVNTRLDNQSQRLYQQTLGAEVEAVIKKLYSGDEALMIARNVTTD